MGKVKAWAARAVLSVIRWAVRNEAKALRDSTVGLEIAGQLWTNEDIRKLHSVLRQSGKGSVQRYR